MVRTRSGKWNEFQDLCSAELDGKPDAIGPIGEAAGRGNVTLLYSAHDTEHSNAAVLKDYLAPNHQLYGGDTMFVVFISFPPIKEGKDAEFREWFASTNEKFSNHKGFIRRRLLRPLETGNYAAIVEFENQDDFEALHSSSEHDKAGERVKPLFDGNPIPHFYEVIIG